MYKLELGALMDIVYPALAGLITIIIYVVGWRKAKKVKYITALTVVLVVINLSVGICIRYVDF